MHHTIEFRNSCYVLQQVILLHGSSNSNKNFVRPFINFVVRKRHKIWYDVTSVANANLTEVVPILFITERKSEKGTISDEAPIVRIERP